MFFYYPETNSNFFPHPVSLLKKKKIFFSLFSFIQKKKMSRLQKRQKKEVGDEKVRFIPICKQVSPFTSVVEQRTKEWFHMRRKRLTGSATSSLLFFKSEEERQLEYSRIFEDGLPKEFDDLAKERMQWGVDHEMCGVSLHHFELRSARMGQKQVNQFLGASLTCGVLFR